MKNRKATGPDGINTELFKYGGEHLNNTLLNFINTRKYWRFARIPRTWYEAHVISLFKKGKQNLCCNYRGISLLNTGYKLYTKILNTRLQTITEEILLENQSGFRKVLSLHRQGLCSKPYY
jgi:hypothetical protein